MHDADALADHSDNGSVISPVRAIVPEELQRLGITSDVEAAACRRITTAEARAMGFGHAGSGLLIEYRDPQGRPMLDLLGRPFCQLRYDGDELPPDGRRYSSLGGAGTRLSFSRNWQGCDGDNIDILVTEGWKKLAILASNGARAVSLIGWSCWRSKGTEDLHGDWALIDVAGRDLYLIPDADGATNRQIHDELKKLTMALYDAGVRSVRLVQLPTDQDRKLGVDDYLLESPDSERQRIIEGLLREAVEMPSSAAEIDTTLAAWLRDSLNVFVHGIDGTETGKRFRHLMQWLATADPATEDVVIRELSGISRLGKRAIAKQIKQVGFEMRRQAHERAATTVASETGELVVQFGPPDFVQGNSLRLNEAHWAARLCSTYGLIYESSEGRFYGYNSESGAYIVYSEPALVRMLGALFAAYASEQSDDVRDQYRHQFRTAKVMRNIVEHATALAEASDSFNIKPNHLHLANGMLDLQTMELLPFSPEYRSRNPLPVIYDPGATCPRFLHEVLGGALSVADIDLLQRWFGVAVLGLNLPQIMLLLIGPEATGKGTTVNVLRGIVGAHNFTTLRTTHLADRFELARFVGKTMLYGPDVRPDFLSRSGASVLKSIVGGDPMTGEVKGTMDAPELAGDINVVITANTLLPIRIEGDAGAWRRRLAIIQFKRAEPVQRIADFHKILLRDESSGILNWAIEGLRKLADDGFQLRLDDEQAARVNDLLDHSQSVEIFVGDRVVRERGGSVTYDTAHPAYLRFCHAHGWEPVDTRDFSRRCRVEMIVSHGSAHVNSAGPRYNSRGWRGVRLVGANDE